MKWREVLPVAGLLATCACGARSSILDDGTAVPVEDVSPAQSGAIDSGASTTSAINDAGGDGGGGDGLAHSLPVDAAADLSPCAAPTNMFYLELSASGPFGPSGAQSYPVPGFDAYANLFAIDVMPPGGGPGPRLAVEAPSGTVPALGTYSLGGNQALWPNVTISFASDLQCLPESGSISIFELPYLPNEVYDGGVSILLSFDIPRCQGNAVESTEIRGCVRIHE